MKCRFIDLSKIKNLAFNTKIKDVYINDILRNRECEFCVVIVNQKQVEILSEMLSESLYDLIKISPWIKCNLTSSDIFYSSRMQKNYSSFIFWLSSPGNKYPKDIPLNFFIEKESNKPYWLKETSDILKKEGIEIELFSEETLSIPKELRSILF